MPIFLKQFTETPNVGDVASAAIVRFLTSQDINVIGEAEHCRPNLIAAGCILHWADHNSIVWAPGSSTTRSAQRLASDGISSPPLVGDPGVFISDIFPPQGAPTIPLGVVPHYVDQTGSFVDRAREYGAEILDVTQPLERFVNTLRSCRQIISSSLHGIIFAHAYGIPAVWVELSSRVIGDGFKFLDYYSSIGVAAAEVPRLDQHDAIPILLSHCSLPRLVVDKPALRRALIQASPSFCA